jgi:CubicO group peptidase (beta-lactamase class C family)
MATRWLEFVTSPWLGGAARHGMTCGASGAPEPGGGHHSVTEGFLVGEVVRRVTGQSLATFFADQVARPLGADFHITLPPDTTTASPPASPRRTHQTETSWRARRPAPRNSGRRDRDPA